MSDSQEPKRQFKIGDRDPHWEYLYVCGFSEDGEPIWTSDVCYKAKKTPSQ